MKNTLFLIGLFGIFAAVITAACSPSNNDVQAEITDLIAKYDSSWNSQDTVAIDRLMAPEYQYFTSRGAVWSRADVLHLVGNASYELKDAKRSELLVTYKAPVAVVSSRWEGHGTYQGKPFTDDQRCGQVWLRTANGWQLLNEHCVQIDPDY